jgi:transmembrane sensor
MDKQEVIDLLKKYKEGTLSNAKKAKLETWYLNESSKNNAELDKELVDQSVQHLRTQLPLKYKASPKVSWLRVAAAAALVISIGITLYNKAYYFYNKDAVQLVKNDIVPGGNKAYLTLANGKRIILNEAANGQLAEQAGIKITKTADGQLVYRISSAQISKATEKGYNTIETPRGGQYQIALPDGTKVWLNAASSLKYPILFAIKERKVELSGEAYFEVAKDKRHPFIVLSKDQEVKVLGTHFNIKSYTEEGNTKTTLLEGAVRITSNATNSLRNKAVTLQPNQEAIASNQGLKVQEADTEEALSWKNGYFRFNDENIQNVMLKISRWYNVEVHYKGKISDEEYKGTISRSKNISEVLDLLESTKTVHFKVEGRRITVM